MVFRKNWKLIIAIVIIVLGLLIVTDEVQHTLRTLQNTQHESLMD